MAQWFYSEQGEQRGPVSADVLAQLLRQGRISDQTFVWREGLVDWEPLSMHRSTLAGKPPPVRSPFVPPTAQPGGLQVGKTLSHEPVVYAGFVRRWLALIIDTILLLIPVVVLAFALGMILGEGLSEQDAEAIGFLVWLFASMAYYPAMESSTAQATFGKQLLAIKVVDLDGTRLSFGRALARWFATSLSYITLYIGFLMAAFTERKQALHDMAAGTLVVDKWAYSDRPDLQKEKLSGCAIAAVVILSCGLFIVPILAAIAIPAYQDYTIRAKVSEVLASAGPAKTAVAEIVSGQSRCPRDWSDLPQGAQSNSSFLSEHLVGEFDGGGCGMQLTFGASISQLAGGSIFLKFDPDTQTWACWSNIKPRYLPTQCRS